MRKLLILAAALVVLSSTTACAWLDYYDGTALPVFNDNPWWLDNNGGSIGVGGGSINISAPADYWCDMGTYIPDGAIPTMVAAGQFKINSMGGSGMSLLLASTGAAQPSTPLGLGVIDNGNFALVDYSGGPAAGTNNPIVLQELGAADNAWHTAYLLSAPDGVWQACVDGVVYSGVMGTNDWGEAVGYAEFAASTYWMNTRAMDISFDWLAYGDETDMVVPEPGSLLALGVGLIGLAGAIRRRS